MQRIEQDGPGNKKEVGLKENGSGRKKNREENSGEGEHAARILESP